MALEVESFVPEESVAPEVVMGASIVNSRTPVLAAVVVELLVPTLDFSVKQVQPSPLLVIIQGNHHRSGPLPFSFLVCTNRRIQSYLKFLCGFAQVLLLLLIGPTLSKI